MEQTWIYGASGKWHLAREKELVGVKTGTVMSRYLVAACHGHQIGGAWGYSKAIVKPMDSLCCPQCLELSKKKEEVHEVGG